MNAQNPGEEGYSAIIKIINSTKMSCIKLIKLILLVMDIINTVISFGAHCYLLYIFVSTKDPPPEDKNLIRAYMIIFLIFHFLAGLVMLCLLGGKCKSDRDDNGKGALCEIALWLLMILMFGFFAQIILKTKEFTRNEYENEHKKIWCVFLSVAWFCTFPLSVIGFIAMNRGYKGAVTESFSDLVSVIFSCLLMIVSKFARNEIARISADQAGNE